MVGWRNRSALQAARSPVLLLKGARRQTYRRVLIATDFSQQSLAAARAALELAPDAQFVAAHAFGVADEGLMFDLGVSRKIVNAYRRKAREVASQRLSEFVQALGTEVEISRAVLYGSPRRIIPHYAANIGADLVALGHTPRTGLRGLLCPSLGQCLARMEVDLLQCAPYQPSRSERQLLPRAAQEPL
jgi:nucleotide-binding universal stress UspA family protein